MTSTNNYPPRPSLSMSYSQGSGGSANGLPSLSHPSINSFNTPQSTQSSTPQTTQNSYSSSKMSLSHPTTTSHNLTPTNDLSHSTPRRNSGYVGYEGLNGYGSIMPYSDGRMPQIYRVGIFLFLFALFCSFPLMQITDSYFLFRLPIPMYQSMKWRSMESLS